MGFLDKLFNLGKSSELTTGDTPASAEIRMGRYSDNNKSMAKTQKWYQAEDLYKEKKYNECVEALFDYLRDEKEDNVRLVKNGTEYSFEIYQGTKIVSGRITDAEINASVSLAKMEGGLVSVMRRLLEMNFSLYYCRYALHQDRLCMLFDSPREVASPNKLYYGLKELATKADKQDDLLVSDFAKLKSVDDSHVTAFGEHEKEVKYRYFKFWIEHTLKRVDELNQDSFSGAIAYMLLTLLYRLDFLIVPEGKLLNEIERINNLYWSNKEEKTAVERNQILKDAFRKLLGWEKEEVLKYFYRSKSTFAITVPKSHSVIADGIRASNENMLWYRDNKYPEIANDVMEYGLAFSQYSYSLPKPVTQLFTLFMHINYMTFFEELGFSATYYSQNQFNQAAIKSKIKAIVEEAKEKYPLLNFNTDSLNFSSLLEFNFSFLYQIEIFNFENPKTS